MANTSRMNRLEELGRVDAEKAYTGKGKRNLRDEKKRIVRELKATGGSTGNKWITKKKKESPKWITKKKKTTPYIKKRSRADIRERARHATGGSVMGRGQGRVMKDRPTFMISMKD
tara:strand:+ start:266 stop:613 length:348 start_codon:yes stop_codon:yes gene_type:complete